MPANDKTGKKIKKSANSKRGELRIFGMTNTARKAIKKLAIDEERTESYIGNSLIEEALKQRDLL